MQRIEVLVQGGKRRREHRRVLRERSGHRVMDYLALHLGVQRIEPGVAIDTLVRVCAGFSLHAAVHVPAGATNRLEKLIRYAARPPIVEERLSLTDDGKVSYRFRTTFRDESRRVVMDPLTFIERLAALVPRPLVRLVTYHGLFAPAAPLRDRVVPPPPLQVEETISHHDDSSCAHRTSTPPTTSAQQPDSPTRKRYSWAELMQRVFDIDVFLCACGGRRRLLAFVADRSAIRRLLTHLGLPADPPNAAPARPPPMQPLPFA